MELVRQPPKSNLCGQACVATLLRISLDDAKSLVGRGGKTNTSHLVKALRERGAQTSDKAIRHYKGDLPNETLILSVREGKFGHWIIYHKRKFYDPAAGVFREMPRYLAESGARVTSYVRVELPKEPSP